jgi:cation transport ATPase
MNIPATIPPRGATRPQARVTFSDRVVTIEEQRLFSPGSERPCARFVGCVLAIEGVRSVSLDRTKATLAVRHCAGARELPGLLERFSAALRGAAPAGVGPVLPRAALDSCCTLYRHGTRLSTCEILADQPGRLQLRHPSLRQDRALAREVEHRLAGAPGVLRAARGTWTASLFIHYDPSAVTAPRLIRLVEDLVDEPGGWGGALPAPARAGFALPSTTLGTAVLGEFVIPAVNPLCALLVVGTNLRTFKAAWLQLRGRQLGLPVLYTAILASALTTGRFLSCALMSLCYKFWHDRLRLELATELRRLLHGCLPRPRAASLLAADGSEVLVPLDRLEPGARVLVGADETVPADGRVVGGEAIVDERSVSGREGATRKKLGDPVLAGSSVLAGSLRVEITQPADRTRASSIARALIAASRPAPGTTSPALRTEAFADRAVGPTLATAGVGLLVGDMTTLAAILPPDYATGPGVTLPLETLRNAAACARRGIIIRQADVFERLARVDLIVIHDDPALSRVELEVTGVETALPEAELLRYAASAYRHLVDDRASALAAACRNRGAHLLELTPVAFHPGVTVVHQRRRIRVFEPDTSRDGLGSLVVEIDGARVGVVHFGRSARPVASAALRGIRESATVPIALVSNRSDSDAAALGSLLGVDICKGGFAPDDLARFLRGCRERGLHAAYVGRGAGSARACAEAYVGVSLGEEADMHAGAAAAVLLQPRLDLFVGLWETARAHEDRVRDAQNLVLVPNVFCVAGAFLFGFTSLTAVMVTNLATFGLYSRAAGSLHALNPASLAGASGWYGRRHSLRTLNPPARERWTRTRRTIARVSSTLYEGGAPGGSSSSRPCEGGVPGGSLESGTDCQSVLPPPVAAGHPYPPEPPLLTGGRRDCPAATSFDQASSDHAQASGPATADDAELRRIKDLPREVGVMLMSVGVLGFILPGVMGTPAIIAGGLALWPRTFSGVEEWLRRRSPSFYRRGMNQLGRFLDDLETRYADCRPAEPAHRGEKAKEAHA